MQATSLDLSCKLLGHAFVVFRIRIVVVAGNDAVPLRRRTSPWLREIVSKPQNSEW